jgi:hypothetical protein
MGLEGMATSANQVGQTKVAILCASTLAILETLLFSEQKSRFKAKPSQDGQLGQVENGHLAWAAI